MVLRKTASVTVTALTSDIMIVIALTGTAWVVALPRVVLILTRMAVALARVALIVRGLVVTLPSLVLLVTGLMVALGVGRCIVFALELSFRDI